MKSSKISLEAGGGRFENKIIIKIINVSHRPQNLSKVEFMHLRQG